MFETSFNDGQQTIAKGPAVQQLQIQQSRDIHSVTDKLQYTSTSQLTDGKD